MLKMPEKIRRLSELGDVRLWPVLLVVLAALSAGFSWLERADHALLDAEFRMLRKFAPRPVTKDVVVVGMDEAAFSTLREPFALWHPHIGKFFHAMAVAKPSVLGLDVVLPEKSVQFLVPGYDQMLLQGLSALKSSQVPVVLGRGINDSGVPRNIFTPYVNLAGEKGLASVMSCADSDGVMRLAGGVACNGRDVEETLSGVMAGHLGRVVGQHGLIDYSAGEDMNYVSFLKVLEWQEQGEADKLRAVFGGRPVLLGAVLPFSDRVWLPVPLAAWEPLNRRTPGVLLHAQSLRSMLSGGLIGEAPRSLLVLACALSALFWFGRTSWLKLAMVTGFAAGVFFAGVWLLGSGSYLPAASVMVSALLAAGVRMAVDGWNHAREKRALKQSFGGYVSPQIMDEILAGRLVCDVGGELRRVCIMFADVRGFTTLSESMAPQAVLALLNRYYEEIVSVIHAEGGTLNCIMGDGIMVIFGAPKSMDNPAVQAFAAARKMLEKLSALNRALQSEGVNPLTIGIGLNVGDAVVGHVGSRLRHDYSAIGNTTNVAARLEGLAKETGYPLVCSDTVVAALGRPQEFVGLGQRAIKGHSPVEVYGWREAEPK